MRGVQQASNARIEPADFMHLPPTYFNDDGRLDPRDRVAPGAVTHATPASGASRRTWRSTLPSRRAIAARLAARPCVRSSTQKPLVGGPIVEKMVKYDSELRKRKQHVQRQPAHRGGGVELLGHRDERDIVLVEQLDELGKVRQRAGQAIDLVDHDDVDLAGLKASPQSARDESAIAGAR